MSDAEPVPVLHIRQTTGLPGGADAVLSTMMSFPHRPRWIQPSIALLHKPECDSSQLAARLAEASGFRVEAVPGGAWLDRGQWAALSGMIKATGARLLHAHDSKSNVLALLLARRNPPLTTIATLHGWTVRGWKGVLYQRFDAQALRKFDAVLAVSDAVRRQALSLGVGHAQTNHNGIDLDRWPWRGLRERARGEPFHIGFVGRMSAEKRPRDFVRAAQLIAEEVPEARFWMLGGGPEEAAVRELARPLEEAGRIKILGHLPAEEVPDLLRTFDCLLLTSQTEGLPVVLLEAAAMGVSAVATAVGGVPEVLLDQRTGLLVDAGDIRGMADAVTRLALEPALLADLTAAARKRVATHFSLAAKWARWEAVYRAVLADTDGRTTV